ncbi:MAG TPA: LacI family DNA-binding transcriptional regulator [Tepidisphaeraceae bacterium]|jgi:DNA-binding LacI/PurR family transcriptional regulator|nr:LacI family DNA-binding transcriptional regulator [Tepidisphaeraceae bacterium]
MTKSDQPARQQARPTLDDVARQAGVSRTTVSEVLSQRNVGGTYSESTRRRVREAVRQLGYSPHRGAQRLATGRTNLIGLVITRDFSNPHYARLCSAVEREVARRGMRFQLASSPEYTASLSGGLAQKRVEREVELVRQMVADGVEGLILGPVYETLDLQLHRELLSPNFPIVLFGGLFESNVGYDCVSSDASAGVRLALEHLQAMGHRRIGFLAAPPARTNPTQVDHYLPLRLLAEHGLLPGPQWVFWQPDVGRLDDYAAMADQFVTQWREAAPARRPTAMLCLNDQVALATLGVCGRRSVDVPRELSIVGHDNLAEAAHLVPALTTIEPHVDAQMAQAVDRLLARIADPDLALKSIEVPPHLVERATVAAPSRAVE